jgi:hypothetical protein
MSSKRTSRKRRKQQRAGAARAAAQPERGAVGLGQPEPGAVATRPEPARGYARSRAKDEAARAALKPLRPGERPAAVTVGAIAASVLAVANLVALVLGYSSGEDTFSPGSKATGTIAGSLVLVIVAYGMWKARYWGVLGMQTLLALTLIFASLGLITARTLWAAVLLVIIIVAAGTLFWFLIKAMARIQMPERPQRTG